MDIRMISWPHFDEEAVADIYTPSPDGTGAENVLEFAGRSCYHSFHRPNRATATNWGYLRNILRQKHGSVLEHGKVVLYVTGVSRSLTHELIRHRHLSYSELSQRFVDVESANMVMPPALDQAYLDNADYLAEGLWTLKKAYRHIVDHLTAKGANRKQAREAARAVMPNMTETKIVVSGNFRAWRDVLEVRGTVHADREIRALAVQVAGLLKKKFPNIFQDMEIVEAADGHLAVVFLPIEGEQ